MTAVLKSALWTNTINVQHFYVVRLLIQKFHQEKRTHFIEYINDWCFHPHDVHSLSLFRKGVCLAAPLQKPVQLITISSAVGGEKKSVANLLSEVCSHFLEGFIHQKSHDVDMLEISPCIFHRLQCSWHHSLAPKERHRWGKYSSFCFYVPHVNKTDEPVTKSFHSLHSCSVQFNMQPGGPNETVKL